MEKLTGKTVIVSFKKNEEPFQYFRFREDLEKLYGQVISVVDDVITIKILKHHRCPFCGSEKVKEVKPLFMICLHCESNFNSNPLLNLNNLKEF